MIISSVDEMVELGARIGATLQAGDVILLSGELGAGKTALTRGIGRALGFTDVTSPTFVIAKIHNGALPLVHVDAYRLLGHELAVFDDLDLETRISRSVTVIEWGEDFIDRIAPDHATITISHGVSENERIVELTGILL
jgi:tRNA threonylcarbamoyladenosine biosynthesis protein TsaE